MQHVKRDTDINIKKNVRSMSDYVRLATEKHNEELRLVAEKHDKELFKEPPPEKDCPICFIRLPTYMGSILYTFHMLWKSYMQWMFCYAPVYMITKAI